MTKIKVLHVIKSLGRGGAEMLLPATLSLHNKNMFEFHYIYFLPWKDQMVNEIKNEGGQVTCIEARNNLSLLAKFRVVENYCQDHKINLIHAHLPWSGFLSRLVSKFSGVPLLYTEHNIQERYHILTRKLNAVTFNWQDKAIGVSQDVSSSIIKNIKPKVPVQTVLNGVNTQKFSRDHVAASAIKKEHNIPADSMVVGNLAVFREQKDLICWVNAFKLVHQTFPKTFGLLVGAGPMEPEIKQLIKEHNLEKYIILPGLKTNTVDYLSAMDVFMMSSQFEGLPIALLEAMSTECAIASTKAGGVVEAVDHEKSGLLSEIGEPEQLGQNCIRLLNDTTLRIKLREEARKRVEDYFSLAYMVEQLELCYTQLASNIKSIPSG
jgi:L-malate glycosyltransferase